MDPLLEKIYGLSAEEQAAYGKHVMLGGGTRGGPVLARGKGVRVWDTDGREYVDCTSQSWALYLGHANDEINRVIREHIERMTHIHQGFDTLPRLFLSKMLADAAPGDLNRVSYTVGGGPAIEAAMKIAHKNTPGSRDFICLWDSYHGTTLGTLGASWVSTRASGELVGGSRFLALTKPFIRVPNPYCYRCPLGLDRASCSVACARVLRTTLERGIAGRCAGLLLEPIQASAGQIIFPTEYLQAVRGICDEFDVPLIFDEIQTYGRIGHLFSSDHFGVVPDIIVLGKALGAGLPLAAILVSDRLDGFRPDTEELHTFAQPTLSMVTAAKQIELLQAGVLENCRRMGDYLRSRLLELQAEYPEMGDVRAVGLHIGIEFSRDPKTREPLAEETVNIRNAGFRNGVIFGLGGVRKNVLKIKPPLIINRAECDEVLEKFENSMKAVLR